MIYFLLAGALFGLIHPGGKFILDTGIGIVSFCALFMGVRTAVQIPVLIANRHHLRPPTRAQWQFLLAMGVSGALLRITEFVGIAEGIPVSVISFVIYLHPLWTILLDRFINKEPLTAIRMAKLGIALVSLYLICDVQAGPLGDLRHLWAPLVTGVLIAFWIVLSNRAQREGCQILTLSFYHDLFSFLPLLAYFLFAQSPAEISSTIAWLTPTHFAAIVAFAILTGVLPNYLFYSAVKINSASMGALLMLFEPIVSTLIAVAAWNETMSPTFVWGALGILVINVPESLVRRLRIRLPAPFRRPVSPLPLAKS